MNARFRSADAGGTGRIHPGIRIVEEYDIKEDPVRCAEIIASGTNRYPGLGAWISVGGWPVFTRNALVMGRLSSTVPKADVVVTNPTELAIALQYDPEKMAAPIVVAKGAGVGSPIVSWSASACPGSKAVGQRSQESTVPSPSPSGSPGSEQSTSRVTELTTRSTL